MNTTSRKYYEVWGDTLNMLNFLKTIIIILLFIITGLVLLLRQSNNKPPLVITVDKLGQPQAVKNWESQVSITVPELSNFTQTFIDQFTAYDYYTYMENFKKAFKLMTPDCQKKMDTYLAANTVVDQITQSQYKTKVVLSKIDIVKDSKYVVSVKVKGYREVTSYLNPSFSKDIVFETDLVYKKVPRTLETPWGVLVDYYNETIFKDK
ncbi:MAG: VirB8/TrbF family protein [Elusimicrobiota bacterium]